MLKWLQDWARVLKRDVVALWLAARDARVPWYAKVTAGLVAAYALSPIDLIPDVIPVLGLVDDVALVPLGILLALRCGPPALMAEFREAATSQARPSSPVAALLIVIAWVATAVASTAWVRARWLE